MKKIKSLLLLTVLCGTLCFIKVSEIPKQKEAQAWVGVTYLLAEKGASNEEVAMIGAFGALHGVMEGAIYGAVFGGPAGIIAGAAWGL